MAGIGGRHRAISLTCRLPSAAWSGRWPSGATGDPVDRRAARRSPPTRSSALGGGGARARRGRPAGARQPGRGRAGPGGRRRVPAAGARRRSVRSPARCAAAACAARWSWTCRGPGAGFSAAGEPLGVRVRVMPLTGPDYPTGHVAIEAFDVTEAHRVARVRRDFVANVSHELKTPVGRARAAGRDAAGGGRRSAGVAPVRRTHPPRVAATGPPGEGAAGALAAAGRRAAARAGAGGRGPDRQRGASTAPGPPPRPRTSTCTSPARAG